LFPRIGRLLVSIFFIVDSYGSWVRSTLFTLNSVLLSFEIRKSTGFVLSPAASVTVRMSHPGMSLLGLRAVTRMFT